jgi:hypothetical protein
VTTFFHQMPCHGETHNAETEKSDFSHVSNLGVSPAPDQPSVFCGAAGTGSGLGTVLLRMETAP